MRLIEKGEAEEIKVKCKRCNSTYAYCWYDIKDFSYSNIVLVKRNGVLCPVCSTAKILDEVIEENP